MRLSEFMTIALPRAIELYFSSENEHDPALLDRCVAVDAVVHDERKTIRGLQAIKAWRAETGKKYRHTVQPVTVSERDGAIVVTGKVTGNFPGSPIDLDHAFRLEGGKIATLDIG